MSKWKRNLNDPSEIKRGMISRIILIVISILILVVMAIFHFTGQNEFSVPLALAAIIVGTGNSIYLFKDLEKLKKISD
jgi:preprotein translocase subunit SecF